MGVRLSGASFYQDVPATQIAAGAAALGALTIAGNLTLAGQLLSQGDGTGQSGRPRHGTRIVHIPADLAARDPDGAPDLDGAWSVAATQTLRFPLVSVANGDEIFQMYLWANLQAGQHTITLRTQTYPAGTPGVNAAASVVSTLSAGIAGPAFHFFNLADTIVIGLPHHIRYTTDATVPSVVWGLRVDYRRTA